MGGTDRTILIAYGIATALAILLASFSSTRNRKLADTRARYVSAAAGR